MSPVTEAEERGQPLVDCGDLFGREFPVDAPHPPLVDRPKLVDQREGFFRKPALAGRKRGIQKSLPRCTHNRHHTNERKALVANDFRIAHDDARSDAPLFVSDRGIEFDDDHGAAAQSHV